MSEETGFRELVGMRIETSEDGLARAVLDVDERHLNSHGTVHGGAIATLVDSAMGTAVASTDDDARPVTIEMKVTYLEPGRAGRLVATAKVRKKGSRISIVEAEVTQGDDFIAHAISTFTV